MRTVKKFTINYKKKTDTYRDTFVPRRAPKEAIQCAGCGASYHHRRWTLSAPAVAAPPLKRPLAYCPACKKIKQHSASGELQLLGISEAERPEVLQILRNEEARAQEKNPLERIMRLNALDDGWRLETTTEKLAQRLGRSVRKARGGKVSYRWSHNNKFVRVIWRKGEAPLGH